MKVIKLNVARRASYEDRAGELIGTVTLEGRNGSQEIVLTNQSLSTIFKVISQQVCDTAKLNAAMIPQAMSNATHEPLMLEAQVIPEFNA